MIGELKSGRLTASLITSFYAMNDAFALKNARGFAKIVTHVRLLPNPIQITTNPRRQIDLWLIPRRPDAIGATSEVSYFTGTKFSLRLRCDVNIQRFGDQFGYFPNAHAPPAPDIHRKTIELVGFHREQIRPRNVLDERKIACLLAIFVEHGRQVVKQTRAEDRDHSCVGIEDRLTRAVGARITQGNCGDSDLLAPK